MFNFLKNDIKSYPLMYKMINPMNIIGIKIPIIRGKASLFILFPSHEHSYGYHKDIYFIISLNIS